MSSLSADYNEILQQSNQAVNQWWQYLITLRQVCPGFWNRCSWSRCCVNDTRTESDYCNTRISLQRPIAHKS